MITDALLNIFLAALNWAWGLLPAWDVPVPPEIAALVSELSKWNKIVPFAELMLITGLFASVFGAVVAFKAIIKVVDWVADIIP